MTTDPNTAFVRDVRKAVNLDRKRFPRSALSCVALSVALGKLADHLMNVKSESDHIAASAKLGVWYESINVAMLAMRIATEGDVSVTGALAAPIEATPPEPDEDAELSRLVSRLSNNSANHEGNHEQ